jgi:hypothetical protein
MDSLSQLQAQPQAALYQSFLAVAGRPELTRGSIYLQRTGLSASEYVPVAAPAIGLLAKTHIRLFSQ